jgi:O-antigen/teichoic acid export membrane protein
VHVYGTVARMSRSGLRCTFTASPPGIKTEVTVKLLITILAFALALPALLVAIALGPVIVGVLCAVGFGLIVFALGSLVIGLVTGVEHAGSRFARNR